MRTLIAALAIALLGSGAWAVDPQAAEVKRLEAAALEARGDGPAAVEAYVTAARFGSAAAARRLGEAHDKGQLGIKRDYGEAVKWFNAARVLEGEKLEGGFGRTPGAR
jgi:TPR repeat protein